MDDKHQLHSPARRIRFLASKTTDIMGLNAISARQEEREAELDKEIALYADSWKLPFCIEDETSDSGIRKKFEEELGLSVVFEEGRGESYEGKEIGGNVCKRKGTAVSICWIEKSEKVQTNFMECSIRQEAGRDAEESKGAAESHL